MLSALSHLQWQIIFKKSLAVWKPELERYTGLVANQGKKQRAQNTGCREKGIANIPCKTPQALAVRIAELTEDLEELRFEKALLLQKFEYAEDAGAEAFRKRYCHHGGLPEKAGDAGTEIFR